MQTEAERDEERRKREELQQHIARFMETVVEISHGDLTKRGEVTNDVLGSVVDAINVMVEELATIVGSVRTAALHVAASSNDMIVAATDMTGGAHAQTREAMSVSTAMEGLTLSVRQVAASAEDSARAAQQALEAAKKGDEAVRESLDGMQRIRREVQTMSKRIKSLGDRSLEISAIVSTIEDIAGQTNLLALNATIEAAGAGEAGHRFAVVADEVRRLAERAARATKDIGSLIKAVQAETQEAVLVTEHGTNEVETGYQITVAGRRQSQGDRHRRPALGRARARHLAGHSGAGAEHRDRRRLHAIDLERRRRNGAWRVAHAKDHRRAGEGCG